MICSLYCNRSAAYLETEKFQDALRDAEKAVELSPKWATKIPAISTNPKSSLYWK